MDKGEKGEIMALRALNTMDNKNNVTLNDIVTFINENVTSENQLQGMRGMGLDISELPASYKAKQMVTNSGITYYIANRNAETRAKLYEKLISNVGGETRQSVNRGNANLKRSESSASAESGKVGTSYSEKLSTFSSSPDLVAENSRLSPCKDTECTHTKEYYNQRIDLRMAYYNHRFYYMEKERVMCVDEKYSTEPFCIVQGNNDNWWRWNVAVNYYGIVVYGVADHTHIYREQWNKGYMSDIENEEKNQGYSISWFDFSGKRQAEIKRKKGEVLVDLYLYGSRIFYILFERENLMYYINVFDMKTKKNTHIGYEKCNDFAITRILGNNERLFFYLEDLQDKNNDDWERKIPYKQFTGWNCCELSNLKENRPLKELFYQGEKCYTTGDECQKPKIQIIDVKNNIIWVSEKINEGLKFAPFYYEKNEVKPVVEHFSKWNIPSPSFNNEIGDYADMKLYFDGKNCYYSANYYTLFSYNQKGERVRWNEDEKHGRYQYTVVLGGYVFMDNALWIDQYPVSYEQQDRICKFPYLQQIQS